MKPKKKILAFTGIRSDYDLMSGLYKKLAVDSSLDFGLIVSGAHLSATYGNTVQYIEKDNLNIVSRIESLLDSNTASSRLKSASILLQGCIQSVERFSPDLILLAGDREDAMVAALVGAYMAIPTIHFFGGDHSPDGNVDHTIRHAVSKLVSLHFVAHEEHAKRLQSLGEAQRRIHFVGSPALDKFLEEPKMAKQDLLKKLGRPDWDKYALVIFHPSNLIELENSGKYFEEILTTLKSKGLKSFVSYPNVDPGNKQILNVIEKYRNDSQFVFYANLPRSEFINLLRQASLLIGNSSAGLYEAPFVKLGVVNVGSRQRGRLAGRNVVFCDHGTEKISEAIDQVLSGDFQKMLVSVESPYGDGHSVDRAYKLIKDLDYNQFLLKIEDCLVKAN